MSKTIFSRFLKIFLLLVFVQLISNTYGQRVRYDDIFEELEEMTHEQAFYRFFNFQSGNPHFANTYIQLGNLSEQIFHDLDPLREADLVDFWANNAALYYNLFPVYLQSNEVRRNREFYTNLPLEASGRRLNSEDVLEYVDERVAYSRNFKDSVRLIYNALEKSKDHYNTSVRIFNAINTDYDNLNEVLLQTNAEFLALLVELDIEFNACLQEFEVYKSLLEAFPLSGYNQSFEFLDIETFRLDGLTNSDFLLNEFTLWDYASWVRAFRSTYSNDIVSLRNEIENIQKLFDNNLVAMNGMDYAEPEDQLESYDELFLYRLGKYDNNSLVRELFHYLDSRQNYLFLAKNPLNNPMDTTPGVLNRKLRFYHRNALQLQHSQSQLEALGSAITPMRVRRFYDYFNRFYQGQNGLHTFTHSQSAFLKNDFEQRLENLKTFIVGVEASRDSLPYAKGRRTVEIPLYPISESYDNYAKLTYITTQVVFHNDLPLYAGGYIKRQGRNPQAFVAKITEDFTVDWLRELGQTGNAAPPNGDKTQLIFMYEGGLKAMVSAIMEEEIESEDTEDLQITSYYTNSLVSLAPDGTLIERNDLENPGFPVFLNYDEINQVTTMGFGNIIDNDKRICNGFILSANDSAGVALWSEELNIMGELIDIVSAENSIIAFFNFKQYDIRGDRRITGSNGKDWALMTVELKPEGTLNKTKPFLLSQSYFVERVFGISSTEFNLLGYEGEPGDTSGRMIYMLMNSDAELLFSNR